jgi:GNAT superfamily N-acetyltransferase
MVEINPLTEADVTGYANLLIAAGPVDDPEGPELTRDRVIEGLRSPDEMIRLVARRDGEVVGAALAGQAGTVDTGLSILSITVHPAHRRQGIGTALLEAVRPELRARGLDRVATAKVVKGTAGEHWALARGFRVGSSVVDQRLTVAEVDQSLWDVPVPPGHRVERWTSETPEHLVPSVLKMSPWSHTEMLHGFEAHLRATGVERRVVAAVEDANGTVAALADLLINPKLPTVACTTDTAATPPELARFVKAQVLRWLVAERPEVEHVEVKTLVGGRGVVRVNSSLGFVTTRELMTVSRSV